MALALYWDDQGVVPLALLACILHELGHLLTLRLLGGELSCLRLSGVGAEMIIQGQLGYWGDLELALSGPLTNLLVALAIAKWGSDHLFCGLNLALCALNLLPMTRLDGGRGLYSLCSLVGGTDWAEDVRRWADWFCSAILVVSGVAVLAVGGSFTLLIFATWAVWTQKTWKFHKKRLA